MYRRSQSVYRMFGIEYFFYVFNVAPEDFNEHDRMLER